jgi:hypothetical protein
MNTSVEPRRSQLLIIYYDRAGNVKAVGAEAVKEGIYETAEDEHLVKAEWYVLIFSLAAGLSPN